MNRGKNVRFGIARVWGVSAAVVALAASGASAVVVYGPQGRNTSAPTGELANSGWQYEGFFNQFAGTAVAPNYFVTAEHVGGSVGDAFTYNGKTFHTVAAYDDPKTDLRLWKVDGDLGAYAPLYRGAETEGKVGVYYGRGTQRGAAVTVNGVTKGWQHGASDGALSWGTNTLSGMIYRPEGNVIASAFEAGKGDNEAGLSSGDSGGGVFVKDGGAWKLAAVNFAIDGPFSTSGAAGSGFAASLYDTAGVYSADENGGWRQNAADPSALHGSISYSTSVYPRLAWIDSVIGPLAPVTDPVTVTPDPSVPEPAGVGAVALGAAWVGAVRRRR